MLGPTQYAYNRFPCSRFIVRSRIRVTLTCRGTGALDDVVVDKGVSSRRAAMHSRPYIVKHWGEYFEVLAIVDAIAGLQDFVVLRRR